ncbi:MAG: hypothetical protein DCO96_04040 [Fluviicola sp. XM-24bin1]|nr:MAG: hypothetical protein DCO96_04040 [Fluviicola sp. XM-24bin1]
MEAKEEALSKESPWAGEFIKFGVFMANLVEANSAEEVQAVIESAALPVGSSALRKNSVLSVNVTSYLGASMAFEKNMPFNVTAPIGVDVATGFGRGGSLALNVSPLDVGAIVDYRLSENQMEIESVITLGNIFSPGFHLVYGGPFQVPLSIGGGVQYGPGLTNVSAEGIEVNNAPGWSINAFLAVDMPLFNFYNRQRAKL